MDDFFDEFFEVYDWLSNTTADFFSVLFENTNAKFRAMMYAVIFIGISSFLAEVIISFILSFRFRKPILFNIFKLKYYKSFVPKNIVVKDRNHLNSRHLSTITDRKVSVISDRKLSAISDRQYSVVSERDLYERFDDSFRFSSLSSGLKVLNYSSLIPRYFSIPDFRLYSSIMDRHYNILSSRYFSSLHNDIDEKHFTERYYDTDRYSGVSVNSEVINYSVSVPRSYDLFIISLRHQIQENYYHF